MRTDVRHDVRHLTRLPQGRAAPLWWGMVGLILIEGMVVASFIASYFYLQLMNAQWPPEGAEPPPVLRGGLVLALLLAGSAALHWSNRALDRGAQGAFAAGLPLILLAGGGAAWLLFGQFDDFATRWDTHAYASLLWTVTGLQLAHLFAALAAIALLGVMALRRFFTPWRRIGVTVVSLYWHFVALSWIPLYLALYWTPRWF